MKKTTVFYMGRQINGRFDSFKARVRRVVRFVRNVLLITGAAASVFLIGAYTFSTSTVDASTRTIAAPVVAPVLDRISDCESGSGKAGTGHQFAPNGQVMMHANKDGTVDIGKYAINNYFYGAKATELGYDLTKEADNKAMAEWIYLNKGTRDWSASQKCWYR